MEVDRSYCVGCPAWRVTFRGAGTAEFECLGGCAVPGKQSQLFSRTDFAVLVSEFEAASFFETPRLTPLRCSDCDTVTLTYRDEHRIHEVVGVGSDQTKLAALSQRMFEAASVFDKYATPTVEHYKALLDDGWDPNGSVDGSGGTMLNYAVYSQDKSSVAFLLKRGARPNVRALEETSVQEILELLWTALGINASSKEAGVLLRKAAAGNWTDNIVWLLSKEVDVNARDLESGLTPLMAASRSGYERALSLLLSRGATLELRDAAGNQALWYAAERDVSPSIVNILVARGLKVDDVNLQGKTPLMHAAESCAAVNVNNLIRAGADPNRRDKSGRSAKDLVPAGRGFQAEQCQRTRMAWPK